MSIIAIVSGIYCSGEEIAQGVAEQLGYKLVGDELLESTASQFGTSEKKLLRSMTGGRSVFNLLTRTHEKSIIYLKAAAADLLIEDDLVYHGPVAYLMPVTISHMLRVGVYADLEYRIERAVEQKMDAQAAEAFIRKQDEELTIWTQEYLARGPWDSSLFDIKIDLPATSLEEAVELVCAPIKKTALMPTEHSIQAARDSQLGAQVNLALLERGYVHCEASASRCQVVVEVIQKSTPAGALRRTMSALRLETLEDDAQKICQTLKGVQSIEVVCRTNPTEKVDLSNISPASVRAREASLLADVGEEGDAATNQEQADAEAEKIDAAKECSIRVLLVDDEPDFLEYSAKRLAVRGMDAQTARDGMTALAILERESFDVVVLDLAMPGMDGHEVHKQIMKRWPGQPVIILTGQGTIEDAVESMRQGVADYLSKPVLLGSLADKICTIFRQRQD